MISDGQRWAIGQLQAISKAANGTFEVMEVVVPAEVGKNVEVMLSIDCRGFTRKLGGVPLRQRERLRVLIPAGFPLTRPDVYFTHKRYADFPHVQWGNSICLYQAPEVEWQPSDGMFGFMQRVNDWLRAGAADELDPIGGPLHPPVAYPVTFFFAVPTVDTPTVEAPYWSGYAEILRQNDRVAELGGWTAHGDEVPGGRVASTILLPTQMPHEYPASMRDLIDALTARDVPLIVIRLIVQAGILSTPAGEPALFLLGAAMRGISGGARRQHLTCWRISAETADALRSAILAATAENPVDIDEFYIWASTAKVEWCRVLEDRPEIVERRDSEAVAAWWRGRHVALLGCGAIGSAIAGMVARAGVAELQLYDHGIVTPGVLVRQNFRRGSLGYLKAYALKADIEKATPRVKLSVNVANLVSVLSDDRQLETIAAADVIIDATASATVAHALELHLGKRPEQRPPVIAMSLGHQADFAMMSLSPKGGPGLGVHVDRRFKIALANAVNGRRYLDEFWPMGNPRKQFQPEPGCSSPTFRGSFADVLGLSARMANVAASWLAEDKSRTARAFAMDLSDTIPAIGAAREITFAWAPDHALPDHRQGYEIRISRDAYAAMLSWVRRSERVNGRRTETGGHLFGQFDEFLKVIWIDEVGGPPPDSIASPEGFVCGTEGVLDMQLEKAARARGSVTFVGMWHTHPRALPMPSPTDFGAMEELLKDGTAFLGQRFLMLIVGGTAMFPMVSANVFDRAEYER